MVSETEIKEAYQEALEHGEKLPYEQYKIKLLDYVKKFNEQKPQMSETNDFIQNIDPTRRGAAVPPMPRAGEVMKCQMCGKPMIPNTPSFSKDHKQRMREFKWHICDKCWFQTDNLLDRSTHGLLSERGKTPMFQNAKQKALSNKR